MPIRGRRGIKGDWEGREKLQEGWASPPSVSTSRDFANGSTRAGTEACPCDTTGGQAASATNCVRGREKMMRLVDVKVTAGGGRMRLTGRLEGSDGKALPDVWFEYPEGYGKFVREDADAFAAVLVVVAMIRREAFETELAVSLELAEGLYELQGIYGMWYPKRLTRVAPRFGRVVRKEAGGQRGVGAFFSGGVDSFYTVLKERYGIERGTPLLTHLIYINGLETPLGEIGENREGPIGEIARELGLELIVGWTNLRDVFNYDYGAYLNGPALAAAGLALGGGLSYVVIPASGSFAYEDLRPWGSHPMVDRLCSTECVKVRQDGADAMRSEKMERVIARDELALRYLCSCTKNKGAFRNCGKCPKCVRTMVALKALGVLEKARTFPQSFDYSLVGAIDLSSPAEMAYTQHNLELAKAQWKDARLVRELEKHIRRFERRGALRALVSGTSVERAARAVKRAFGG